MLSLRSSLLRRAPQVASVVTRGLAAEPLKPSYDMVEVEIRGGVGIITLNRPKALNALCDALMEDIVHAARALDDDSSVGALVLTGKGKAFAAGADIKEMKDRSFIDAYQSNMFESWTGITRIRKPTIAAVNGFALGGGCELAMSCDIMLAADNAVFGQPEVKLGVLPGCGGTQRLIRAVGKAKAMALCLTGDTLSAADAERAGLVAEVVPGEELVGRAVDVGQKIAGYSQVAVAMIKETVNASYEMSLAEGLRFERRVFHAAFATNDQKEGMSAFAEKRAPNFTHS